MLYSYATTFAQLQTRDHNIVSAGETERSEHRLVPLIRRINHAIGFRP